MISPIGFTGIKNIGYTKFYTTDEDVTIHSRYALNMQLTDDEKGKDLTEYKKLLKEHPDLKNEVNGNYLNVELDSFSVYDLFAIKTKMNGKTVIRNNENYKITEFMDKIVRKIASFKTKDFDTDEWHHLEEETLNGLVYNEHIDDYVDGTEGSLDLLCQEYNDDNLNGTSEPLVMKIHRYLNDENAELKEGDDLKVSNAIDYILETLHNPMYVHNGAVIMGAIIKGMNKNKTGS